MFDYNEPKKRKSNKNRKFYCGDMNVGDTMIVPIDYRESLKIALWRMNKKMGRKFTTKKVVGNILITRIE